MFFRAAGHRKQGVPEMNVSLTSGSIDGGRYGDGTTTTGEVAVNVTGGSGAGFSYSWACTGGGTPVGASSTQKAVSAYVDAGTEPSGTLTVTVTDLGTGATKTASCSYAFEYRAPLVVSVWSGNLDGPAGTEEAMFINATMEGVTDFFWDMDDASGYTPISSAGGAFTAGDRGFNSPAGSPPHTIAILRPTVPGSYGLRVGAAGAYGPWAGRDGSGSTEWLDIPITVS